MNSLCALIMLLINECNEQSGHSVKYDNFNYMDKEITEGKFVCKYPLCIQRNV